MAHIFINTTYLCVHEAFHITTMLCKICLVSWLSIFIRTIMARSHQAKTNAMSLSLEWLCNPFKWNRFRFCLVWMVLHNLLDSIWETSLSLFAWCERCIMTEYLHECISASHLSPSLHLQNVYSFIYLLNILCNVNLLILVQIDQTTFKQFLGY